MKVEETDGQKLLTNIEYLIIVLSVITYNSYTFIIFIYIHEVKSMMNGGVTFRVLKVSAVGTKISLVKSMKSQFISVFSNQSLNFCFDLTTRV